MCIPDFKDAAVNHFSKIAGAKVEIFDSPSSDMSDILEYRIKLKIGDTEDFFILDSPNIDNFINEVEKRCIYYRDKQIPQPPMPQKPIV